MILDFNKLKKRFQPDSIVALTIETGRILASVVHRGVPSAAPITLSISASALQENPVQAGTELAQALRAAEIREHRCVVCVPPSWALLAAVDLPEAVAAEDLRSYFELRAEREFSTTELRLAHSAYTLPDGKQRATLAALPIQRMEAVDKLLAAAGLRPVSIALALEGCLSRPDAEMHLHAHGDQTNVVISAGGGIAMIRSLPNPTDSAVLPRELRITMGRLPEAVRQQLRRARIIGEKGIVTPEMLERIGIANVNEEAGIPGGAAVENAERLLRGQPIPFEYVIPKVSRWPAILERINTRRGRQITAAAAALILLPMLVFFVRGRIEAYYENKWNGMKNNVADVENIQQKIRKFRPWFQPTPQKLEALRILISAFPERGEIWTRSIQITAAMEKGEGSSRAVQSATISSVNVSGFARSRDVLLNLQNSLSKQPGVTALQLKQIRGNNPIQFSLSYKWEPKHD